MERKALFKFLALATFFLAGFAQSTLATHLRAGEITVTRSPDNCTDLTFIITVTVYTDTESEVRFGGPLADALDVLDFGDGSDKFIIPEIPNTLRPDLGENIGIASFTITHTYRGPGRYLISYREPNRNQGVLNMINSVETTFYIETEINIDASLGCNNSPLLLIPPVDKGCIGVAFQHNAGAYDPDGDSLSYEIVIPFRDRNQTVAGFKDPNNPSFYTGNFNQANENQDGPPTFSINSSSGTITWDAPGSQGEYNIAFHIVEWRKVFGNWQRIGYVRRDMQIIIEDCDNERPDLIIPNDTCIVAGTTLEAIIYGIDFPNSQGVIDQVKIEAFSEIFGETFFSPAAVSPNPAVFQSTVPDPAELSFSWVTDCQHIKDQPYQIVFKITDNGNPNLVTFKTWLVTVVGPEPIWDNASVDFEKRHAILNWNDYTCDNASTMQVWRRVGSYVYDPGNCETGMPEIGFELIAEVSADAETYTDTNGGRGLSVGAEYCYRLVAIFPLPIGGESYVSDEICIDPIKADAPVITHVTVQKTDEQSGEIRISWRSPFEIDKVQFPPPYYYKVWRSVGFTGAPPWTEVHTGTLEDDTTEVDTGINTFDNTYSYQIVLSGDALGEDTIGISAVASMVQLEIKSKNKELDLSWTAFVPWSNQTQLLYSRHLIYRGPEGTAEENLTLIDSVDVSLNGFIYLDSGQYESTKLEDDKVYCYRVVTRGAYGNPAIDDPLGKFSRIQNFSQMVCAQPSDSIPPPPTCLPPVQIANLRPCEEYFADEETCGANSFSNELIWNRAKPEDCDGEILGYRVYTASGPKGEFLPVMFGTKDFTKDTVYLDEGLTSFAKCYKISVVDRSGNESELSEAVCNDNCPFYDLPNVFTPNGDKCNDVFSAYSDREVSGEETPNSGQSLCSLFDKTRCARFVKSVSFKVYNRWGQVLYDFESVEGGTSEKTIYIDWDGRDNNGTLLSTGVYFYSADVNFNTLDNETQTIKGWVHLIR